MATHLSRGYRWVCSDNGDQPAIMSLPVSTGETIKRGYPLIVCPTTGSVHAYTAADTGIYAIADEDKTTTATEATGYIKVIPMAIGYIFEAKGAAAVMTKAAGIFRALNGSIRLTTAGYYRINTVAASARFKIVDYPSATRDATGAGRKWWFKVMASASQYHTFAAGGAR